MKNILSYFKFHILFSLFILLIPGVNIVLAQEQVNLTADKILDREKFIAMYELPTISEDKVIMIVTYKPEEENQVTKLALENVSFKMDKPQKGIYTYILESIEGFKVNIIFNYVDDTLLNSATIETDFRPGPLEEKAHKTLTVKSAGCYLIDFDFYWINGIISDIKVEPRIPPFGREMLIPGKQVMIDVGPGRIIAQKESPFEGQFLLVSISQQQSLPYFGLIPIAKADELSLQYGDFMLCDSPGANAARENVLDLMIVARYPSVHRKIQNLDALGKKHYPVIEIKAMELRILDYRQGDTKLLWPGSQKVYLVDDINIVREDFK